MVLIRKAGCDGLSLSHSVHNNTSMHQVFGGVEVQLSGAHARAVAQDNKVACCHPVGVLRIRQPSQDTQPEKLQTVSMAAQLYLGAQHGAKGR